MTYVKLLDAENANVFSKHNGDNFDAAANIVQNQLGKVFWGYAIAWAKAEDKNSAQLEELLK